MTQEPIAYINVEKRTLEFAKKIFWHTPTVANIDRIPLFTKEALAQEQEPVAWMFQHDETGRMNYVSNDGIHNPTMFLEMNPRYALVCALYTTPPQRTWAGLTRDEQSFVYSNLHNATSRKDSFWVDFANAIEAKLKEKNT